jgi:hypothetical protein
MAVSLRTSLSVIANLTACRHLAMMPLPRSITYKRRIHERVTGSVPASFMESVV